MAGAIQYRADGVDRGETGPAELAGRQGQHRCVQGAEIVRRKNVDHRNSLGHSAFPRQ